MSFGGALRRKPALRHVMNRYGVRQKVRTMFLRTTRGRGGRTALE